MKFYMQATNVLSLFINDNSRFEKDSEKRPCQSLEDAVGLK